MFSATDLFTNRHKNICEYGGAAGILLTSICLIQHLTFAIPGKITDPMIPIYVFIIVAYIFLVLQKSISLVLLIMSAVLASIVEYLWITHYSFSLVVLLLFLYTTIIVITLFAEQIPQKIKQLRKLKQKGEEFWREKI